MVKIQNENVYSKALDLLNTNLVIILAFEKPLPVWPPFIFHKSGQIDRKIYIIRLIMTEYALFAFATCSVLLGGSVVDSIFIKFSRNICMRCLSAGECRGLYLRQITLYLLFSLWRHLAAILNFSQNYSKSPKICLSGCSWPPKHEPGYIFFS